MNNFKVIFNVLLTRTYFTKNKNSKKSSSPIGIMIFLGFLFGFLSIIYNLMFYFIFREAGEVEYYPLLMLSIAFVLTLMASIFRSQTVLFSTKDHNILTPLPINKKTIISVKLILFYLEEIIYSLFILTPTIVIYSQVDLSFVFNGLLLMLITPMLSILFSTMIGFLISLLVNRFKVAKILSTIIYVAFFGCILYFSMSSSFNTSDDAEVFEMYKKMGEGFRSFFVLDYLQKGFVEHNVLYAIIMIAASILSASGLVILYSICYDKFYNMLNRTTSKKKYNSKQIGIKSPVFSIVNKDLNWLINSSIEITPS